LQTPVGLRAGSEVFPYSFYMAEPKTKILLIDDDKFLLNMYEAQYVQAGCTVKKFGDANGDIVQRVLDINPDVIAMGIIMPGRDGWDALKLLKSNPGTKNIPIFIVSNQSQREDIEKSLSLSAVDHIVMAWHLPEELAKQVLQYFKNPSQYQQVAYTQSSTERPKKFFNSEATIVGRKTSTAIITGVLLLFIALGKIHFDSDENYHPPPLMLHDETSTTPVVPDSIRDSIAYWPIASFEDSRRLGLADVNHATGYTTGISAIPMLTWRTIEIKEASIRKNIDIEYPEFNGGASVVGLNAHLKEIVSQRIAHDTQHSLELTRDYPDSYTSDITLASRYRVIGVQNGIVSVELVITSYTGGGNGNHDMPYTINWDLKSNGMLENADLFCSKNYINLLQPLAQQQLKLDFSDDSSNKQPPDEGIIAAINRGTEDPEGWEYFLPYNGGLIVVFAPYLVSSGAGGIVRTYLRPETLKNIICLP
jgi:CheY-like chemotaxis protein